MDEKKIFGAVLKELREERNMSQSELAEKISKSTGSVGQFERGEIYPNYETLKKIIEYFDVDANIFFFRKKVEYSLETVFMTNLLSQMNESDRTTVIKFQKDVTRMLDFLGNNITVNREGEEMS